MKRTKLNLVVDMVAAVLLVVMIATGYILWFPLPPGTDTTHCLWGLTRYSWGTVHAWISVLLLSVLLVHVVLHWKWLMSVLLRRLGRTAPSPKQSIQIGVITVIVLAVFSMLFGWITYRSVRQISDAELLGQQPADSTTPGHNSNRDDASQVSFSKDVLPILQRSCVTCHGPTRAAGRFRVDRKQDFFSGSNGRPFIVRGDSSQSPLIAIVSGTRKHMPLAERHKLPDKEVELLQTWIDQGADWPEGPDP